LKHRHCGRAGERLIAGLPGIEAEVKQKLEGKIEKAVGAINSAVSKALELKQSSYSMAEERVRALKKHRRKLEKLERLV